MTWNDGPMGTSYFGRGQTPKMAAMAAIMETFHTPYISYLCTNFLKTLCDDLVWWADENVLFWSRSAAQNGRHGGHLGFLLHGLQTLFMYQFLETLQDDML